MTVFTSPYYQRILGSFRSSRRDDASSQRKHIHHLIGHILYVEKRIRYIKDSCHGVHSWKPVRVLNELRTAVLYLSRIQADFDLLWDDTFGETRELTPLRTLFKELYDALNMLYPFELERLDSDVFLVLSETERIGPICSVLLDGTFSSVWNDAVDLAMSWNVPTNRLL